MIRDALARALERHPGRLLLLAGALTAVLAPGVFLLRLQGDLIDLFPRGEPTARELARYARTFGRNDPVSVLVTGGDPVALTDFADRFASKAARVRGVQAVDVRLQRRTLARPSDVFRLLDDEGFAQARALLAPAAIDESVRRGRALLLQPGAGAAAELFRDDPLELRRLLGPAYARLGAGLAIDPGSGYFLSPRGDALVALVRNRVNAFEVAQARALLAGLRRAAHAARPGTLTIQMTGAHAVADATERMIRTDLTRSSALSTVLVLAVFGLAFGRLRALLAVGPPLLLGALWTAGLAGYVLGSLNAISVAFCAILLGLGDDLATHLYLSIERRVRGQTPAPRAAAEGLRALFSPTLVAATTGSIGFLALARSDFAAIRDLGILSAVGILLTAVAVLLVTPTMARWTLAPGTGARGARAAGEPRGARLDRALQALGDWLGDKTRYAVALGLACLALAASVGPPRFGQEVVGLRPRALDPLAVQRQLFARFGGEPGQIVALVRGRTLEQALARNDEVAATLARLQREGVAAGWSSLSTLFPSARTQAARLAARDRLGLDEVARTLEARLRAHGFAPAPFAPTLASLRAPGREVVLPDLGAGADALFVERHLRATGDGYDVATYARPGQRAGALRLARAIEHALPHARVTGYPLFEAEVRRHLPADLSRVGAVSIALVVLTLLFHFRRLGPALVPVASVAVGIAWMLLACVLLGVTWTAYNLIVIPVIVGISIDESVFLVHRFLEQEGPPRTRVAATLGDGGRAVLTTASTTAAGFATLALCEFDGLRSLGITAALGIGCCLLATLVITPALLPLIGKR